ncbi:glycosyltransferase [Flagellimonas zhangzhouensis]|uniref:Glycosyltransferase involved in cell wall bisynthesis n=1 Tax=Flagellimonas zhangzhouensis TaxID=1073328 RepID=A0A1H2SLE8_9FLAO|nr:glycosyltransferase [Allomuricauda zhangzhouensis]SDQ76238.1 Glycosyltransferase involved in cell wall bisynthesis [Allomuricauda zhangzhouensis]SDW32347.1 Glycosyltransferase involved in cell wall bisynthesis [Allomuricauda zhangzhouensis]
MSQKLLVIGYVWPEPTTTAAGGRMQQLLEAFLAFGYQITFASTASKTEYSLDLQSMRILETPIQLNHSSFDDFIQELKPEVVVFDRFMMEEQFGWRVAEFAPNALRILNTEDLHALRKAREEAHKQNLPFDLAQWKNHPITLREVASIYRCDVSLMISTFEMDILEEQLQIPSELLLHLPFMVDVLDEPLPSFEERKGFVSIGNGKHAPNVDAVKILRNEIWPLIRKQLPKAELHIYGAYLPQQVNEMHDPNNGFLVEGWAKNAKEVLTTSRVLLAPIQFGAGIKGKLLDAMRTGTPTVTTSIGAEGMHGDQDWNGTITDDWDIFAQAAIQLYHDQEIWRNAQKQGVWLLQNFYNKEKLQLQFKERLQTLTKTLDYHRSKNFIGKMLQSQTMSSTKYMAKWIEAKNKTQ